MVLRQTGSGLFTRVAVFFAIAFTHSAHADSLAPEVRAEMTARRDQIRTWAPTCDGALANDRNCGQGDMLEYAGLLCLSGETARCEDVRRSQGSDGKFWRAPQFVGVEEYPGSFSRDMLMGALDYLVATKDIVSAVKYIDYLNSHHGRLCAVSTENECSIFTPNWGMMGRVFKSLGIPRLGRMKLWNLTVGPDLLMEALTVPKGFPMELVAHNLILLKKMGYDTEPMRGAAQHLAQRQPENPLFEVLAHGASAHAIELTRSICPGAPSKYAEDIFWQRELIRNDAGEIELVRDWGLPHTLARETANGHDCLLLINLLLNAS